MTTRNLFEIGADILAVNDWLLHAEDENAPDGLDKAVEAFERSLREEEAIKLDGYLLLVRQLECEAAACDAEAEQFAQKAKNRRNRVRWLKARLHAHLVATGRTKAQSAAGRVLRIQANGGVLPLLYAEGVLPEGVPEQFQRVVVDFNSAAIRKALEGGEVLDFATLGERGSSLRIG